MSFAGVCIVSGDGKPPRSVSDVAAAGTAAHGYYLLVIDGYAGVKQRIPNGERVTTSTFRVGGHSWYIEYYPNGEDSTTSRSISIYLILDDDGDDVAELVKVQFEFSFVHEVWKQDQVYIKNCSTYSFTQGDNWGYEDFAKWEALERSKLLRNQDCLTIRCDINVVHGLKQDANGRDDDGVARSLAGPAVPPSDMWRNLGDLLHSKESTDVIFEVGGVTFPAHRCILAARSAVFKAELFGPMKEGVAGSVVRIDDMEAHVFMALLAFIYTDLFPECTSDHENIDDYYALCQHLLVAADRYDLQRLKLMCEAELCKYMKKRSVSGISTLAELADRFLCRGLKEACLEFLETHKENSIMQPAAARTLSIEELKKLTEKLKVLLDVCGGC